MSAKVASGVPRSPSDEITTDGQSSGLNPVDMSASTQAPAAVRWVALVLSLISGGAIVLLMFGTTFDVFSRKLHGEGLPGVIEWSEVLLVIVVFSGMMSAELSGAHIRGFSLLPSNPRRVAAAIFRFIAYAVSAAILGWVVVQTTGSALESYRIGEFRMGIVGVPVWPAKIAIPVGMACFAAVLVYFALRHLSLAWRLIVDRRRTEAN